MKRSRLAILAALGALFLFAARATYVNWPIIVGADLTDEHFFKGPDGAFMLVFVRGGRGYAQGRIDVIELATGKRHARAGGSSAMRSLGHDNERIWLDDFTFFSRHPWTLDVLLTQRDIEERNPAIRDGVGQYARWVQADGSLYVDSRRGEHFVVDSKTGDAKPTAAPPNTVGDNCWGDGKLSNPDSELTLRDVVEGELKHLELSRKTPEGKLRWSVQVPYGKLAVPHVADGKVILGVGDPVNAVFAFDPADGRQLWRSQL